jgi:hypothetical protein
VTRFLLCGACYVAAAWSVGATVAAAMHANTDRMVGFAALTVAALALSGVLVNIR